MAEYKRRWGSWINVAPVIAILCWMGLLYAVKFPPWTYGVTALAWVIFNSGRMFERGRQYEAAMIAAYRRPAPPPGSMVPPLGSSPLGAPLEDLPLTPEQLEAAQLGRKLDRRTPPPGYGTCAKCGCTDERACPGGCAWANADHNFCTKCAGIDLGPTAERGA